MIGIIASLIGILLPTVIRAREQALSVKCLSNERQVAEAALIQANAHHGYIQVAGELWNIGSATPVDLGDPEQRRYVYYPEAGVTRPLPFFAAAAQVLNVAMDTTSRATVQASLNAPDALRLFNCPAQPDGLRPGVTICDTAWQAPTEPVGYVLNEELLSYRAWSSNTPHGHLSQVRRSSSVMLLADGTSRADYQPLLSVWGVNPTSTLATYAAYDTFYHYGVLDYARHAGRINVVFCDGHAEAFRMGTPDRHTVGDLDRVGTSNGIY